MAGHNSPVAKDEKAKKRKRGVSDGETKPKRHQRQRRHADDSDRGQVSIQAPVSGPGPADTVQDLFPQDLAHQDDAEVGWRIGKPMGGRILDIDPILTADERHLILAYNTSVQVFNAADSLLVRRIPICVLDASAPRGSASPVIVSMRLSKLDASFVWVACSDGQVYSVNWTAGTAVSPRFRTVSGTAKAMAIVPTTNCDEEDIVLVAETDQTNNLQVLAYQGKLESDFKSKKILALKKPGQGLHLLEASEDGLFLVGAVHDSLFLGSMLQPVEGELDELQYRVFSFDTPDLITTLDLRCYARPSDKRREASSRTVVDVLTGGARGAIYSYRDAFARVEGVGKTQNIQDSMQVHKFHWHRKAVHSVKWSRDGNYFISGGSENVLVLWQVDTSKRSYLPHLSASIENIVVSASGASYVVHLDDNSAMILSTAELKPTAFVSGIQTATVDVATPKDSLVKRLWRVAKHVQRPIPAAIRPSDPAKLHVCVGGGRQATMSGAFSAPLLQTFDLESFTSHSKQALARIHPTDTNLNVGGRTIDDPRVSHIAFSSNGHWLASVDEWQPSVHDLELVSSEAQQQFIRERQEIYLRFWKVSNDNGSLALVSRINAPHGTSHPEPLLDLASDPTATGFASLGGDGTVRLWRPQIREQNGVMMKSESGQEVMHWGCVRVIAIGEQPAQECATDVSNIEATSGARGSIAFAEDGSTLFVAFGHADAGVVYVVDAASGQVVKVLDGLWQGQLHSIRALSSFVVVLSDELRVYDVVSDELRYGIALPKQAEGPELLQLAVDWHSGRFAVALPMGHFSSIGIFDPADSEPLLVRSIPHRVVSLVSPLSKSGFIALDDVAQTWVMAEGSDAGAVATMQPLEDMHLDEAEESRQVNISLDEAEMSDDEMGSDQVEKDASEDKDEDRHHAAVVPQQHLADIFDAAPAFAAPPVEKLFYQVADLLTAKTLPAVSA